MNVTVSKRNFPRCVCSSSSVGRSARAVADQISLRREDDDPGNAMRNGARKADGVP